MDQEKIERLNSFLYQHSQSIDSIPKSRLNQLDKIDDAIQAKLKSIESAKAILKGNNINVSIISNETNISRKTFYNNDLLRLYVEKYETDGNESSSFEKEITNLKEKNNELSYQVKCFLLRDIETENLKNEIDELNKEIVNLQVRNESLEQECERLRVELDKARTIIPFPKK